MKKINLLTVLFACLLAGCQLHEPEKENLIIVEPTTYLLKKDSIMYGSHLGIAIGADVANVYTVLQSLTIANKEIQYVNVVSNIFTDLEDLRERIPLYQGILLDQTKGTDSGVQISFESGKVKSIFLNNGQKLNQWPANQGSKSSVRVGDQVTELYTKLSEIKKINSIYASRFERISMFTKDLATPYDPITGKSPQWYFGYAPQQNQLEVVQVHFLNGKVSKIITESYRN